MTEIFNQKSKTRLRKQLRSNLSKPEQKLWYYLRKNQLGIRFRRQVSIQNKVVDFYSPKMHLVIEIDGDSHYNDSHKKKDKIRDKYFKDLELKILRFNNKEVMENIESVIEKIQTKINPL